MHFLFDLINHVAGYTDKYYKEMAHRINHEGLIEKYRNERKKYEQQGGATAVNFQDSDLLGDKYPHALMVIESLHELMNMCGGRY